MIAVEVDISIEVGVPLISSKHWNNTLQYTSIGKKAILSTVVISMPKKSYAINTPSLVDVRFVGVTTLDTLDSIDLSFVCCCLHQPN